MTPSTHRKLLLLLDDNPYSSVDPSDPSDGNRPQLPPPTTSSSSFASRPPPPPLEKTPAKQPPLPNPPFDSSIPLTIIVLLTALFFMAFFSLYIRCFSGSDSPAEASPRRGPNPPFLRPAPSSSKGGADPAVVKSLPLVGYGGDGDGDGEKYHQSDCTVCLSEFEEEETVKVIPRCRHVFHPECLDTWLSSHVSCPVCRTVQLL